VGSRRSSDAICNEEEVHMSRPTRFLAAVLGSVAAVAVIALAAGAVGAKSGGRADTGTVYLAVTHTVGNRQYAAGNSYDKLFGTGAVTYVNVATATPTGTVKVTTRPVVLFYKDGTLTGSATSTLTVGRNGAATITGGKLTAANGTGGQKGHSFTTTFSGSGSLTTSTYKLAYKGTYK
jgi:hypothetical protein